MNIFRNLFGKVWQDSNAAEVVKISSGQLYLIRPDDIRTSRECIYNEAMATVRRVPSVEHNFQLVITRVYEDGDQELLEDEDETDEERVFLIGEELQFRTGQTDGEPTFVWRDLDGGVDEFYEFVGTGTNEPTRAFFEICMYRAMYERKFKTSADVVQDADLEPFVWRPPTETKPVKQSQKSKASSSTKGAVPKSATKPAPSTGGKMLDIFVGDATLYPWDPKARTFLGPQSVTIRIAKDANDRFKYWLIASTDDGPLVAHEISSAMNHRMSPKALSVTWNHIGPGGQQFSWAVTFKSTSEEEDVHEEEAYMAFSSAFSQALWEAQNRVSLDTLKSDEQTYVRNSNVDVEMRDIENEEDEGEVEAVVAEDEEEEQVKEEDEDEDGQMPSTGDRNSQLTVGYKGDRSYVLRGNNIGVFRHSNDEKVNYYATISKIATPKGKEFDPMQVMLHDQDSKMVLMNSANPNSLFSMDIEVGKVVEEWKVHESIQVKNITPKDKLAQMTSEQTLVGISPNALFRIDPRQSGNKLVESQFKQYASKTAFSSVTTTSSGRLAVASDKGEIRLFDSVGKIAKTALPPLGDPIIGIDVTGDGRWVIATTRTYLLLIDTLIGDGRNKGSLGFDRNFPATAKPIPRRLQLRNEHVAFMNHEVNFTPARFNMGGQEENAIVTSTGQYVVAWDFAKVKKGLMDKYEIKRYEDLVVQDNFKFGDDKQIIVALQNNVLAVNKKNLRKPTRHSLGGELQSRSSIVNSPY